jgi:ribonuclease VapC
MVIDSSALIAILQLEPDAEHFVRMINRDPVRLMSTATLLETSIVLDVRRADQALIELDRFIERSDIILEPVTTDQAKLARVAFRRYGRGNHPARLNFGDCFVYALASASNEPVLFKGTDFNQTDIRVVE